MQTVGSGANQKKFYKKLIKQAEERYEKYLNVSEES
jgi:hypothetical protein